MIDIRGVGVLGMLCVSEIEPNKATVTVIRKVLAMKTTTEMAKICFLSSSHGKNTVHFAAIRAIASSKVHLIAR